ncbi:hypothetical protein, partial [Microseira sp. BLCC-F43]|uniref:hypothetical protein n=1 Tax=Microseira sp. BLCC-F43 TaxID=3153602 RepID=UPI0035B72499
SQLANRRPRTTGEIRVTTVLGVVVRAMSNGGYLLFKESSRLQAEECQGIVRLNSIHSNIFFAARA